MTTETDAVAGTPSNDAGEPNATDVNAAAAATTATDPQTTEPKAAEPVVPESYEFVMPEGIELDSVAADEFTAVAKELKLDQATAQKVADVGAKMVQRQAEAHAKLVESWVEAVKSDKDIGGDALAENLAVARKALDTFGTPELRDVLNATGLGNHPGLIKMMHRIGKTISDDRFVQGSAPQAPQTDMAKKMFPTMN